MKLIYHPKAMRDLEETTRYYASIDGELGRDFKDRIAMALLDILRQPLRYRVIEADIRKCTLKRFPYAVYFRIIDEQVQVLVVKHHRRHPSFGMDRS